MDEKQSNNYTSEPISRAADDVGVIGVNASGHRQELERNFNLLSITSVGITTGSAWPALGGTIIVAIYNGGPPGVIYEFLAVSLFYCFIAASIAELASAIPSSTGVYHFATVAAGPKYGKVTGYFAGWWNYFAWIFGAASMSSIMGNMVVAMWALFHQDYVFQRWHVFIVYIITTWLCCSTVLFANRLLPTINTLGTFLIIAGVLVTIIVCAVMPTKTGSGYASNGFVWSEWQNQTGWTSDGLVFLAGMLNGAFAIGTPDCVTHLAEEIPNPGVNVPKAIAAQIGVGILTGFLYLVAIFYATNNLSDVLTSTSTFPLAAVYNQATNSQGGALGLLILVFIPIYFTCIGIHITSGRVLWSLARDKATPFSHTLGRVSQTWKNPFNAHLTGGIVVTILGCIYIGSSTAFNAFVGSFVVLSSASYVAAILPHILNRRQYIKPGPFYMKGILGYIVSGISSAYILAFIVIYCFPFVMPVSALTMNYASLITGGLTIFVALWWLWIRTHGYAGPRALMEDMKRISMQESSHSEHTELGAYSSGMSTAGERYEVPGDAYEVPRRI